MCVLSRFAKSTEILACAALCALAAMSLAPTPARALGSGSGFAFDVSFHFPEVELRECGDGTAEALMESFPEAREPGLPVLPSREYSVAIPPGYRAVSVKLTKADWRVVPGEHRLAVGQPPAAAGGGEPRKAEPDPEVYGSDLPYPRKPVTLEGNGRMRACTLARLRVSPVRYRALSGVVEACRTAGVRVHCAPAEAPGSEPRGEALEIAGPKTVYNFDQARGWYRVGAVPGVDDALRGKAARGAPPAGSGDAADYVMIAAEDLSAAVEPLKLFKEAQGYSVLVRTTGWLNANYPSEPDLQARTRRFLKENYAVLGIDYVLLVGTDATVPMRRCYTPVDGDTGNYTPTDYYYSDLSGEWDLNRDGKYGQWGVDDLEGGVDFYPEVFVGRLPGDDPESVTEMCERIVGFQTDGGAWKKNALLLGAVSNFEAGGWPGTWGSSLMEEMREDILEPAGYSATREYERQGIDPDPLPGDLPLTRANALGEWERGYGIVNWWAHGSPFSAVRQWWDHDDGDRIPEDGEVLYESFIDTWSAGSLPENRPGVVFSCSCDNARPEVRYCLINSLMEGAACAAVGSTRVSWYTVGWKDEYYGGNASIDYFFWKYLIADGEPVGKALRSSDVTYKNDFFWWGDASQANLFDFNLYGDPSMTLVAENVPPVITSVTPARGRPGDPVVIDGLNFGAEQGASCVSFGGRRSDVYDYWSNGRIRVRVPKGATSGPVEVVTPAGVSNRVYFRVEPAAENRPSFKSISPVRGGVGTVVTISGERFGPAAPGRAAKNAGVFFNGARAVSYPSWSDGSVKAVVPEGAVSGPVRLVTASGGTVDCGEFDVTRPVWYLAEGSTRWGFSTYISIENPNSEDVPAEVTYMTGEEAVKGGTLILPAMSQTTIEPGEVLGERDFSTRVECTVGKTIAVDRTMMWSAGGSAAREAHSSVGVTSPARKWYLPEGSSDWGFECWLLIQNPGASEATCRVTYMIEGKGPRTFEKKVPGRSRKTFYMAEDIGAEDASIEVESDLPVIAERAMYRNNRREGHASIGSTAAARDFYLVEGTTGHGFTTYVLVQNPGDRETEVNLTYMTPDGPVPHPENPIKMPRYSRKTVRVNDFLGESDFSTHVEGSTPVIAERAMYWDRGKGEACHDSIGLSSAHTTFYFPDGQNGWEGCETYMLIANPNPSSVEVEIWYLTPTGRGNNTMTGRIPAFSRHTFPMYESGLEGRAASLVRSKTPGKKILAERAMYWDDRSAGSSTVGGYSD